jgi:dienelactone hydrolase
MVSPHRSRRRRTGAVAVAVAVVMVALFVRVFVGTATAQQSGPPDPTAPDPTAPGPHRVAVAEYHLGDTAFRMSGFVVELAGVVHYPTDVGTGTHPLVMISHGLFATCADRAAGAAWAAANEALNGRDPVRDPAERARQEKIRQETDARLSRWPCAAGVPAVPNFRGYDYLADRLASFGFVVVSVSANGINAGSATGGDDFPVRAALVDKHLQMWQQLSGTGGGPLGAVLPGAVFRGHVDLTDVGTIGHSRGGRAAVYQAADAHRGDWPAGVQVKAVVPLEPVLTGGGDDYLITRIPFLTVMGSCDSVSNPLSDGYFDAAAGRNRAPIHQIMVHGANHNFFNTQWSPSSGQVTSVDDAYAGAGPPYPSPGHCRTTDASHADEKQLTEDEQRRVGIGYICAFLRRYLAGETAFDPMLTGTAYPLSVIARVDVDHREPARPPADGEPVYRVVR